VLVNGDVYGLYPNSEPGFHVHEKGDMPNIVADGTGTAGERIACGVIAAIAKQAAGCAPRPGAIRAGG
jgi:Cu/Zn superoxide dismutase